MKKGLKITLITIVLFINLSFIAAQYTIKYTGDYCVINGLRCSTDGKNLEICKDGLNWEVKESCSDGCDWDKTISDSNCNENIEKINYLWLLLIIPIILIFLIIYYLIKRK